MRLGRLRYLRMLMLVAAFGVSACQSVPTPTPIPTATEVLQVRLTTTTPQALATMGRAMPLPLATPGPTPTPMVYVVQPGDTLLGIAQQYNVSVDSLESANPDLRPDSLQVGQHVLIPGAEPEPAGAGSLAGTYLLPTATPEALALAGLSMHETPVGSLWFLGEVRNPGTDSVDAAEVEILLLDAAGKRLDAARTFVALDVIPPGERAPFAILFSARPPGMVSFEASIVGGTKLDRPGSPYMGLAPSDIDGHRSGALYRVNGVIRNTGDSQTGPIKVVVTLYDSQDAVTGFGVQTLPGPLAPGASLPFDSRITIAGSGAGSYHVIAEGQ